MDGLKRPPFGARFSRGAVRGLTADIPLEIMDGAPVLPELIRWALSLNEGDLLIASPSRGFERSDWNFASYLDRVSFILEAIRHPWPFLESDVFHGSMAAVGPGGALVLPDEAAGLVRPGETLYLRAEHRLGELTLVSRRPSQELALGPFHFAGLAVEARYKVPIDSDLRVTLPKEALWALGLSPGDRLAGKAFLGEVAFGPPWQGLDYGSKLELELEPDGTLLLPESLRIITESLPRAQALLIATVSQRPSFQITQWVDPMEGEER